VLRRRQKRGRERRRDVNCNSFSLSVAERELAEVCKKGLDPQCAATAIRLQFLFGACGAVLDLLP